MFLGKQFNFSPLRVRDPLHIAEKFLAVRKFRPFFGRQLIQPCSGAGERLLFG